MNDADKKWERLLERAKLGEITSHLAAPEPAWTTRVAACALAGRKKESPWELRFAWRALGLAAVVTVVALGASLHQWSDWVDEEAAALNSASVSLEEVELS
jgi:hypothetical protein